MGTTYRAVKGSKLTIEEGDDSREWTSEAGLKTAADDLTFDRSGGWIHGNAGDFVTGGVTIDESVGISKSGATGARPGTWVMFYYSGTTNPTITGASGSVVTYNTITTIGVYECWLVHKGNGNYSLSIPQVNANTPVLAPPSGLSAGIITDTTIPLTWTNGSVYAEVIIFTGTTPITTLVGNVTSGTITGLTAGQTVVDITVAGSDGSVSSAKSNSITETTTGGDILAPVLVSATVEDGAVSNLVLTYDEVLDVSSVPAIGDFSVNDGSPNVVTNVSLAVANTVTLTLTNPISYGQALTVSYTKGVNPIQDPMGNEAIDLVSESVTNNLTLASVHQALLDRATVLGYTLPSVSQRAKQITLLNDIGETIFNKLDQLKVMAVDGDSDFSLLDWKTPESYEGSTSGTVTFTADQGQAGDGSTGYIDTFWNAQNDGVNHVATSRSFGAYIRTWGTGGYLFGGYVSATNQIAMQDQVTQTRLSLNKNLDVISRAAGMYIGSETGTDYRAYVNGVELANDVSTSTINDRDITILALRSTSILGHHSSQVSFFFTGGYLTPTEVATLTTAFDTYLTSL